jgi:AcrR family transcriptional regulator
MNEDKRRARRERILDSAQLLFNRFGYRKTSLTDIANEAGVGKATLYHYVKGKEDIFHGLFQREFEAYRQELLQLLREISSPQEKLRAFAETTVNHHRNLAAQSPLSLEERMEQFPNPHVAIFRIRSVEIETLSEVLEEGMESGVFRKMEVSTVAALLFGAFKGLLAELNQNPQSGNTLADQFLDVLFKGLLVSKRAETEGSHEA